jgi:hypothetical protein
VVILPDLPPWKKHWIFTTSLTFPFL